MNGINRNQNKTKIHRWPKDSSETGSTTEESKRSLPDLVKNALNAFERRLNENGNLQPTLAEYLKLLQFEKEHAPEVEGITEITVTWIEPEEDYSEE